MANVNRTAVESTPERSCDQCGDGFVPVRYWQRFCSKVCKNKWEWAHPDRGPLPPRSCEICDDEFTPSRSWQRYCSKACRVESERRMRWRGEFARLSDSERVS